MKNKYYRCSVCGNKYRKTRSDRKAMREAQKFWPGIKKEDCGIVCDDCYQKIRPDKPEDIESYIAGINVLS